MKLRVGAASDIGQARERNEDAYLAEHPLYVVADGMGGHRGGEVASSVAIEAMAGMDHPDPDRLPDLVQQANRAVFDRQAGDRSLAGMGTTVTAVLADGSTVHLAHVGDSRAYLLRDGRLRQLTEDHTLVQRMVDEGKISEEEAHVHPQRGVVTRAVGVDQDVDVDAVSIDVVEGDRLLLCTDGLTGMMREESVQEILESHPDPQEAADALVDAANRAGGLDNITVLVIDFVAGDGVEVLGEAAKREEPRRAESDVEEAAPDATGVIQRAGRGSAPASTRSPEVLVEGDQAERSEQPAPGTRPQRARTRWRRVVLWVVVALVVIAAGLTAFRVYLDRQWYLGVQDGHVAIFRGLPTDILGYDLSSPVAETGIPAREAEQLEPYRDLEDGITVGSREDAASTLDRMRDAIRARQREQQRRNRKPGGTG